MNMNMNTIMQSIAALAVVIAQSGAAEALSCTKTTNITGGGPFQAFCNIGSSSGLAVGASNSVTGNIAVNFGGPSLNAKGELLNANNQVICSVTDTTSNQQPVSFSGAGCKNATKVRVKVTTS